jgi:hypothetical protein
LDAGDRLWYNSSAPPAIGLAAPIASLLARLATDTAAATED